MKQRTENNRENHWNWKLAFWKDQQDWQTFSWLTKDKRGWTETPRTRSEGREHHYWPYRYKKAYQGILWITVHQHIRLLRWSGHSFGKVQTTETTQED